ncbi:MAG: hypothetical protein ACI9WU_005213 [Myxococcota bacterium]
MGQYTSKRRRMTIAITVLLPICALAKRPEPVGTWRYRDDSKTAKVVVIGGSISARQRHSFTTALASVCRNAELVNKSETGYGARALRRRFRAQLLRNPHVPLKDPRFRYWVIYSGGLNSVHAPDSAAEHTRGLFADASRAGVQVVAFTLTPWGDLVDERWRGWGALAQLRSTRRYVEFILRSVQAEDAATRIEVAVDLWHSALRAADAALLPTAALADQYARTPALRRRYPDRDAGLREVSEAPRFWLRKELRSFDHIHPNTAGHRLIAQTACPSLPASWGCDCSGL